MPEIAISEYILTTVTFWVCARVDSTLRAYIFSSEQGGKTQPHAAYSQERKPIWQQVLSSKSKLDHSAA